MNLRTKYIPISVNFHYTRVCNFKCGFCFHTQKSTYHLPLEDAINGLKMLKESGTKKINIAGGEPFSYPNYLGELVKWFFSKKRFFQKIWEIC